MYPQKVGDHDRRTGEGTEQCCPAERSPRHYNLDFSTFSSSVYTDVFNLGILLLDNFQKKNKVGLQVLKFAFLDAASSKHSFFLSLSMRMRGILNKAKGRES